MMKLITTTLVCLVWVFASTVYAEPIELQYGNNKSWNGETGQSVTVNAKDKGKTIVIEGIITRATSEYIMVDGEFIFVDDIISISSNGEVTPVTDPTNPDATQQPDGSNGTTTVPIVSKPIEGELPKGVFVLPLHQMVGTYFRPTEIKQLIEHIDENYGPGQIIVFEINSGGGSVKSWSEIRDVIFEARERHRFVAWITHAISGAAASGFLCDEIYYKSSGELGSITMYSGSIENVAPDWQLYGWITELEGVLAKTSHTPLIAGCMVKVKENFSYDKDPETGNITYYADESGSVVLSAAGRNLTLGAQEALDSGMCDGIADTTDELAAMLDLEEWVEIDQFGRKIAENWWATLKKFEDVNQKLQQEFGGNVEGNTPKERLLNQIKAGDDLLRWAKKLGETALMMGMDDGAIDRIKRRILDLKHQLQLLDE